MVNTGRFLIWKFPFSIEKVTRIEAQVIRFPVSNWSSVKHQLHVGLITFPNVANISVEKSDVAHFLSFIRLRLMFDKQRLSRLSWNTKILLH